jgi:hypothetical protein
MHPPFKEFPVQKGKKEHRHLCIDQGELEIHGRSTN